MRFFSEAGMRRYTVDGKLDWPRLWRDYSAHLRKIDPVLAEPWRSFSRCDLHDQRIVSTRRPRKDVADVETNDYRVHFTGVRRAFLPESGESAIWLYTELDVDPDKIPTAHIWTTEGHWEIVADSVKWEERTKEKKGSPTRRYRQPR